MNNVFLINSYFNYKEYVGTEIESNMIKCWSRYFIMILVFCHAFLISFSDNTKQCNQFLFITIKILLLFLLSV